MQLARRHRERPPTNAARTVISAARQKKTGSSQRLLFAHVSSRVRAVNFQTAAGGGEQRKSIITLIENAQKAARSPVTLLSAAESLRAI